MTTLQKSTVCITQSQVAISSSHVHLNSLLLPCSKPGFRLQKVRNLDYRRLVVAENLVEKLVLTLAQIEVGYWNLTLTLLSVDVSTLKPYS